HALHVNFDAVDCRVLFAEERPDGVKGSERDSFLPRAGRDRAVRHAADRRQTAGFETSAAAEPQRDDLKLPERVQLPRARDAAGGAQYRLESDDASRRAHQPAKRDGGVTIVRADVDPGFTRRDVVMEPFKKGSFGRAEDG